MPHKYSATYMQFVPVSGLLWIKGSEGGLESLEDLSKSQYENLTYCQINKKSLMYSKSSREEKRRDVFKRNILQRFLTNQLQFSPSNFFFITLVRLLYKVVEYTYGHILNLFLCRKLSSCLSFLSLFKIWVYIMDHINTYCSLWCLCSESVRAVGRFMYLFNMSLAYANIKLPKTYRHITVHLRRYVCFKTHMGIHTSTYVHLWMWVKDWSGWMFYRLFVRCES